MNSSCTVLKCEIFWFPVSRFGTLFAELQDWQTDSWQLTELAVAVAPARLVKLSCGSGSVHIWHFRIRQTMIWEPLHTESVQTTVWR